MKLIEGEWTPTRRKVWAEAHRHKVRNNQAEIWNFIHPDERSLRFHPTPPSDDEVVRESTPHICSIWIHPVTICLGDYDPRPLIEAHKVHDAKNDDTFYVSREGYVWVETKEQPTNETSTKAPIGGETGADDR